jgi:integrase
MVFLDLPDAVELALAHGERYQAFIFMAVNSGMRWSELVGCAGPVSTWVPGESEARSSWVRLQTGEWLRKERRLIRGPLVEARETWSKSTVVHAIFGDRSTGDCGSDFGRFSPAATQSCGPCDALTNGTTPPQRPHDGWA